jgi:hypothetical protein
LAVVAKYNPLLDALALPTPLPFIADQPGKADATAPAAAHDDPSLAEPAGDDGPGTTPSASAEPPPGASAAPPPAKRGGNSVYLSDQELLKMQSATDEGEVSE